MALDLTGFSPAVVDLLAPEGAGGRLLPLVIRPTGNEHAVQTLRSADARTWFPGARAPEAALAGLWLYFGYFDEAHGIAQDIPTAEGSYWHGILHRQEPDAGNAGYWFRRVGRHPIFADLRDAATEAGYDAGRSWDPFRFIDFCEQARIRPGSADEKTARRSPSSNGSCCSNTVAHPSVAGKRLKKQDS